ASHPSVTALTHTVSQGVVTATVTTAAAHGLSVGATVTISGASPAAYNGTFTVTAVADATHFSYLLNSDPGAAASGAQATTRPNDGRQLSLTYPGVVGSGTARVLSYNYNSGLDSSISRLSSLSDSGATFNLESYRYLGLNTVVERDHPQSNVN